LITVALAFCTGYSLYAPAEEYGPVIQEGDTVVYCDVQKALRDLDRSAVRRVFEGEADRSEMIKETERYYRFLRFLDDSSAVVNTFRSAAVRRQLDALQVLLPDSFVTELEISRAAETGRPDALSDRAGRRLEHWWRSQDPYPATEENERLQEHLQRVWTAFRHYHREDDDYRLDDRGRVYVRFGAPNRSRQLYGGEFWTYAFQGAAEFLFVCERGKGCEFGRPSELLPSSVRMGMGPSERGMRKAIQSLSILEDIYGQLSHHRSRYGITHTDLSMYKEQVRLRMNGHAAPMNSRPHTFVQEKLSKIKLQEAQAQRHREKVIPTSRSAVREEYGDISVSARWIRSLTEDGETKADLYWGVLGSSLEVDRESLNFEDGGRDRFLLSSTFVQYSSAYERQHVHTQHSYVPPEGVGEGLLDARQEAFTLKGTPHAALQVSLDRAIVQEESETVRPVDRLKVGTTRADSITPLSSDSSVLEMSDLTPMLQTADTVSVEEAPVYPYQRLHPESPLALSFEVYHLSRADDERTRYTLTYEIFHRADQSGFQRIFQDDEKQRTAVQSRVQGNASRTKEYVILDPSRWASDRSKTVRIRVTVTDEKTSEQVSRSLEFNLLPES
jgi:GWxTD domain-containing protein